MGYESVWLVGSGRNSTVMFGCLARNALISSSGYGVPTPRKVSQTSVTGGIALAGAAAGGFAAALASADELDHGLDLLLDGLETRLGARA